MDASHFHKFYEFEMEQRNAVAFLVNIPLVVLTALASGMSIVVIDYQYSHGVLCYVFAGAVAIAFISLMAGLYFLCRSLLSPSYQKIPNLRALKVHSDSLEIWWLGQGISADDAKVRAKKDFDDYLNDKLAEAAAWNGVINTTRGAFIQRALIAAATAAATLVPAGGMYVYNKTTAPDKIYGVKVTGQPAAVNVQFFSEEPMRNSSSNSNPASSPAPSPATPAPAPAPSTPIAKPIGPVNEFFKTHTIPDRPTLNKNEK